MFSFVSQSKRHRLPTPGYKMKYYIKREIGNIADNYRYFAEDENGRFIEGVMVICPIDAPQSQHDKAVEAVIFKLKHRFSTAELIKTIEL